MNHEMNGRRLGDAVRDHVPAHPHAPLDLADVKAGASRIRRRRTVTGIAVAAVAAAVITPTAFLALGGGDVGEPIDPVTQTPTPTLVPTPRADVTLSEDAPRGDDALDWSHPSFTGNSLPHDALPEGTDRVARLGDGWLANSREDGRLTIFLLDADGEVVQEFGARSFFAVSDDHELVAWTTGRTLMLMDASGQTRELAQLPGRGNAIDVAGGAGCVDESRTDDCRVVVNYDSQDGPDVVTGDGEIKAISEAVTGVTAAFSDFAAGSEKPPAFENEGCTRLIDITDVETQWRNCDVSVSSFSPDGRWMTVVDKGSDGWGPSRIGIADAATGKVFFWIDPDGDDRGLGTATWEGSEHLVVDSYHWATQEWRLFRVSLTGEEEQAAEMVEGDESVFPFIAPIQP